MSPTCRKIAAREKSLGVRVCPDTIITVPPTAAADITACLVRAPLLREVVAAVAVAVF
jgi:hypothetical protein